MALYTQRIKETKQVKAAGVSPDFAAVTLTLEESSVKPLVEQIDAAVHQFVDTVGNLTSAKVQAAAKDGNVYALGIEQVESELLNRIHKLLELGEVNMFVYRKVHGLMDDSPADNGDQDDI